MSAEYNETLSQHLIRVEIPQKSIAHIESISTVLYKNALEDKNKTDCDHLHIYSTESNKRTIPAGV